MPVNQIELIDGDYYWLKINPSGWEIGLYHEPFVFRDGRLLLAHFGRMESGIRYYGMDDPAIERIVHIPLPYEPEAFCTDPLCTKSSPTEAGC